MKYIEHLTVPPSEGGQMPENREKLTEYLPLGAIRATLEELEGTKHYDSAVFSAADYIAQTVHHSLEFKTDKENFVPLTPKNIRKNQTTNCYGYTVVQSECLSEAGIPHYVAFMNTHALTVVTGSGNTNPWIVDPLAPQINAPIHQNVSRLNKQIIDQDIAKYGRGSARFYSRAFTQQLSTDKSFEELVAYNPWLSCSPEKSLSYRISHDTVHESSIYGSSDEVLIMSLFDPEDGRKALEAYSALRVAIQTNKRADAYRAFKKLGRYYPDIDIRQKPHDLTKLAQELGSIGCIGMAKRVVDDSMESFTASADPRFKIWQADVYRSLGNIAHNPQMIQEALDIYKSALSSTKYPKIIEAKLEKGKKQLSRLLGKQAITA